ncbi:MAG TPA: site-2 protease family protein [Aliidongia sp.]|uniref:site-2 protease family protein n=1 Tax=Aliidongia sp. TaxID=1914230 RepID=UPI002DDCA676|nr:site-2 protease family protein [Aliidongia sp.]HEV2678130.1 site-2 protease family protein [Aliidongia sp.]
MPLNQLMQTLQGLTVWVLPVLFAITLHEAAHGYAALLCGDTTAQRAGRLSINPLRHIDPFGTIILPAIAYFGGGFLFGYAKPVPVNFRALKRPRLDMIFVAFAGPLTNIVLAAISIFLFSHLTPTMPQWAQLFVAKNLHNSAQINLTLAIFNLLPIPPLDGGRIVTGLLPPRLAREYAKLEQVGLLILLALLVFIPMLGDRLHMDFNFLMPVIEYPYEWLGSILVNLFG